MNFIMLVCDALTGEIPTRNGFVENNMYVKYLMNKIEMSNEFHHVVVL